MKHILIFFISLILSLNCLSQQYSIEQYLNIRGVSSPSYSFDESKIYFTMNLSGTSQIWYVSEPGMSANQVTFFNERVSSYSANPKKDLILALSDIGGSEYDQFYLLNGIGTSIEKITDSEPKVLYGFGSWSDDGTFFTYYSNKRNPKYYDIFKYNLSDKTGNLIYSSDHSNYPSVISSDNKYLVITRSYSSYDNDLYLLNIESNELKLITLHDNFNEPAEFYASSFDLNNENIYLITNYKNEFYRIAKYNISTGKLSYPEFIFLNNYSNWDVSRAVFSKDKTKMIVLVNVEGYDRIFMHDFISNTQIPIPDVLNTLSITAINFAPNSPKVIIGINSYKAPSVLYEWYYNTGEIKQITYPELAGIAEDSFVEPKLYKYKSFDGLEIPVYIYKPQNSEGKKLPCIISIHGGPESQATYGFSPIFQYFVNAGYVIAEPNVRGSTGYGKKYASLDNIRNRENSVKDIASLVDFLKSRGDVDENRIAVYGGSYGGYMVLACLSLFPDLFAAGVNVVGISNFITFLQNTADYRRSNREEEYGSVEKDKEFLESISPINKVDNIKAPLMIIHGRNDPRVPVSEAEQIYNAMVLKGKFAELHIYEDEGHGISKLKNRLDIYPKIVKFLNQYVKDKK